MMENILASVGDKNITDADLDRIIEKYPVEKRIYFETSSGREQLLEQKIAFTLMSTYAQDCGKDKEQDFLVQMNDLREQILTQRVMQELFAKVEVADEEAEQFYKENPDKFVLEETVQARHILVNEKEQAEQIYEDLTTGKIGFEDAARKYSDCPSKEKGGDLGYFKRGMMVKEFEDEAYTMPLHTVSQPIKTQFGYHIIEVMDKTEKGMLPLAEVSDQLKQQLLLEKQQRVYEKKLEELKGKYGFVKK